MKSSPASWIKARTTAARSCAAPASAWPAQQRFEVTPEEQEKILQRFLQATADGSWRDLMEVLAENATVSCDAGDLLQKAPAPIHGVSAAVEFIRLKAGRWFPHGALFHHFRFEGCPIVIVFSGGSPRAAFAFSFSGSLVRTITVITCPVLLRGWLAQRSSCQNGPDLRWT